MGCKKKRNRFMKIELFETSAVGTPAYADAHFSFMSELVKAYNNQSIERREKEVMAEEIEASKTEEVKEEIVEVKPEEVKPEEVKPEAEKQAEVVTEKSVEKEATTDKSVEAFVGILKGALSTLSVERGLVEEKDAKVDKVKSMSNGELFLAMLKK